MADQPNIYQVYEKIGHLSGMVEQMDKKLDRVLNEHEHRLQDLEKTTDQFVGKAGIVGTITGFAD